MAVFAVGVRSQPSAAQIKKLFALPDAVSVTHGAGSRVWSTTYKKYVWDIPYTVKLKTEMPGIFKIIKGISSFDIVGGQYVYWRDFVSENSYEGIKNPAAPDINHALEAIDFRRFDNTFGSVIGEYESMKMAAEPKWEWHTLNSVSFNVVVVYRVIYRGGRYGDEPQYQRRPGITPVDRIEAVRRIRLYRQGPNLPWDRFGVDTRVPNADGVLVKVEKLLDRHEYPASEVEKMARMSKVPTLTQ